MLRVLNFNFGLENNFENSHTCTAFRNWDDVQLHERC